jgi:hypothetical protein
MLIYLAFINIDAKPVLNAIFADFLWILAHYQRDYVNMSR